MAVSWEFGCDVVLISPTEAKKSVLHGRASKQQVQYIVPRLLGVDRVFQEDEADAAAVAICHSKRMKLDTIKETK